MRYEIKPDGVHLYLDDEPAGSAAVAPEPQPIPLDVAVQAVMCIAAKLRADLQRSEMPHVGDGN